MAKGHKSLRMVIFIKGSILVANLMVMDNTIGQMVVILKVVFERDIVRDMACGKKVQVSVTNMKVSIKLIKNMDMVSSHGLVGMSIKEIMIWM